MLPAMRTNRPVALMMGVFVAGHYGIALYTEAKSGHYDTTVPQPPVAGLAVASSSTSAISVITTYTNAISDTEFVGPAHERRPYRMVRFT
jgi:hypothetical protein